MTIFSTNLTLNVQQIKSLVVLMQPALFPRLYLSPFTIKRRTKVCVTIKNIGEGKILPRSSSKTDS